MQMKPVETVIVAAQNALKRNFELIMLGCGMRFLFPKKILINELIMTFLIFLM
jgi:hypothetical protein